jgi:predicted kinase
VLIITSGLPATGKTTIARELAREIGAVHLRIDTIEQAVVRAGAGNRPLGATRSPTRWLRTTFAKV